MSDKAFEEGMNSALNGSSYKSCPYVKPTLEQTNKLKTMVEWRPFLEYIDWELGWKYGQYRKICNLREINEENIATSIAKIYSYESEICKLTLKYEKIKIGIFHILLDVFNIQSANKIHREVMKTSYYSVIKDAMIDYQFSKEKGMEFFDKLNGLIDFDSFLKIYQKYGEKFDVKKYYLGYMEKDFLLSLKEKYSVEFKGKSIY